MEIYEYLLARRGAAGPWRRTKRTRPSADGLPRADARPRAQSEGADPAVLSDDFDPYLNPGRHAPVELATDEPEARRVVCAWRAAQSRVLRARHARAAAARCAARTPRARRRGCQRAWAQRLAHLVASHARADSCCPQVRNRLRALEARYKDVPKARLPPHLRSAACRWSRR